MRVVDRPERREKVSLGVLVVFVEYAGDVLRGEGHDGSIARTLNPELWNLEPLESVPQCHLLKFSGRRSWNRVDELEGVG